LRNVTICQTREYAAGMQLFFLPLQAEGCATQGVSDKKIGRGNSACVEGRGDSACRAGSRARSLDRGPLRPPVGARARGYLPLRSCSSAISSRLSGIDTRFYLFLAYVLCGALAAVAGVLLTARLETGEANIGASMPLDSIAACVIGGVSLRGGVGSVGNVVLGAIFIGLIQNGMDLAQIQSYLQEVVIGVLLILAVIADQFRQFVMLRLKD